jgi:hypothetical protein
MIERLDPPPTDDATAPIASIAAFARVFRTRTDVLRLRARAHAARRANGGHAADGAAGLADALAARAGERSAAP